MKVVINQCFGGFGLSHKAVMLYGERKGLGLTFKKDSFITHYYKGLEQNNDTYFSESSIERNDPTLIEVVKELGVKANGRYASLGIVEIPDGIEYEIEEYDGNEHIAERHRTWG